ncbi:TRAP transporter large permease [Acuticoccus mangrovi]|uniref:TRAP transporter large permease protein n=1 Tax=Acuticoccus mangrovi TaxID=2796142 RepID=A0A934IHZ2_9HYPH|nr:TRAP transporter large permease subunit [Acuticoccus mangrovi]
MSSLTIGLVGIAALVVLFALRLPIGLVLGGVSFFGIWTLTSFRTAFGAVKSIPYEFSASWSLTAIPMFLLMGAIIHRSGITEQLFRAARLWLNRLPGGLAVATNFASAGFAAASGSSLATATAMARIAVPEMLRYRYDPGLAAGVVASAGTLGALIPPSVMFVLYGVFAEESITDLMLAGTVPGILTALVYAAMIILRCKRNPSLAPRSDEVVPLGERLRALAGIWPLPFLIIGVIGGIYSGVVSATEAGAYGAFLALIAAVLTGRFRWRMIGEAFLEAALNTANIFFIAIGAALLTRFVVLAGIPFAISDLIDALPGGVVPLFVLMAVVYLAAGMFLDPIGIMLITIPLFVPTFHQMGLDGVLMGVVVVKFLEVGLLTPPVGLNVFAVKASIDDAIPITTIFRGVAWFLVCEAIIITLLLAFPAISLTLPALSGH